MSKCIKCLREIPDGDLVCDKKACRTVLKEFEKHERVERKKNAEQNRNIED